MSEAAEAHGRYVISCVGQDGQIKWSETIENVVCTVGKNLMLDTALAGTGYTVVGPYMGLISATSYTAVAAGDTMASHAGWLEAGGTNAPTYTGNRKTAAWSAATAGGKALIGGACLCHRPSPARSRAHSWCIGTGAVATKDDTSGTLWSAGTFTTGDKAVVNGDTLNVSLFHVAMSDGRTS